MDNDRKNQWSVIGAIALIFFGVWLLLGRIDAPWWDAIQEALQFAAGLMWPLLLIALGVLLLVVARGGKIGSFDTSGRKLFRSRTERMIAGVLGGLGAYLGIDPTWLRVLYVLIAALGGFPLAVVAYVAAVVLIPEEPVTPQPAPHSWPGATTSHTETVQEPPPAPPAPPAPPT